MGCHSLLQGIFPTQGSNPGLQHCKFTIWGTTEARDSAWQILKLRSSLCCKSNASDTTWTHSPKASNSNFSLLLELPQLLLLIIHLGDTLCQSRNHIFSGVGSRPELCYPPAEAPIMYSGAMMSNVKGHPEAAAWHHPQMGDGWGRNLHQLLNLQPVLQSPIPLRAKNGVKRPKT